MATQAYQWDDDKARVNIEKHGVSFPTAAVVFDDPDRIERYDTSHGGTEDRYQTIGMAGDVLFVVYMERGEFTRIISARLADKDERRLYHGNSDLQAGSWHRADS